MTASASSLLESLSPLWENILLRAFFKLGFTEKIESSSPETSDGKPDGRLPKYQIPEVEEGYPNKCTEVRTWLRPRLSAFALPRYDCLTPSKGSLNLRLRPFVGDVTKISLGTEWLFDA